MIQHLDLNPQPDAMIVRMQRRIESAENDVVECLGIVGEHPHGLLIGRPAIGAEPGEPIECEVHLCLRYTCGGCCAVEELGNTLAAVQELIERYRKGEARI